MRKHPEFTFQILYEAFGKLKDSNLWILIALFHHWDYKEGEELWGIRFKRRYPRGVDDENELRIINILITELGLKSISNMTDILGLIDCDNRFFNRLQCDENQRQSLQKLRLFIGILHFADSVHAACAERTYRSERPFRSIFANEFRKHSGGKYHPDVIKAVNSNTLITHEEFFGKHPKFQKIEEETQNLKEIFGTLFPGKGIEDPKINKCKEVSDEIAEIRNMLEKHLSEKK